MERFQELSAPSFHIVIRCGEKSEINVDTAAGEIKVNKVRRTPNDDQTLVPNVWGAAKGGKHQFADQLFDYHKNGFLPVPKNPQQGFQGQPKDRPHDHPGLLSIYLIEGPGGNIQHGFAIGLPGGGPEHIRAIRG